MPTKYKILSALIDADAVLRGDPGGYHHVLVDVVDEIARAHASQQELVDALYDLIASSFVEPDEETPAATEA
jgi:hypothetical protein